tara:strand:- start:35975 stop:36226 length:252 start_codon:yes stop_codon:yes gene_type:complete
MEKTYSIINIADLSNIDFSQVYEKSENTIRKNVDESQFVIKYTSTPIFIKDGTVTPIETMNHADCLVLMSTDAWNSPETPLSE